MTAAAATSDTVIPRLNPRYTEGSAAPVGEADHRTTADATARLQNVGRVPMTPLLLLPARRADRPGHRPESAPTIQIPSRTSSATGMPTARIPSGKAKLAATTAAKSPSA